MPCALDRHDELADVSLITVPIDSRIGLGTESAHNDAPQSPFFAPWCLSRAEEVIECLHAVLAGDWRTLARWAEVDSIRLHGVTMTGSRENKLFAWEPENITLFRLCNDLRSAGVPVYFSTDTGPTMVMITHRSHAAEVVAAIDGLRWDWRLSRAASPDRRSWFPSQTRAPSWACHERSSDTARGSGHAAPARYPRISRTGWPLGPCRSTSRCAAAYPTSTAFAEAQARTWYENVLSEPLGWCIEVDGHCVGHARLHSPDQGNRRARYAIGICAPSAWGHGYGTVATQLVLQFAFDEMSLHRVDLRVLAHNKRAIACYGRWAFVARA